MSSKTRFIRLRTLLSCVMLSGVIAACSKSTSKPVSESGKSLYEVNCAICHGDSGGGDGAAGENMMPKASKLADPAIGAKSDAELFSAIKNGVRREGRLTMPPAKDLTDEQISQLVTYLRTLSAKESR